jgi:hypothetical protein
VRPSLPLFPPLFPPGAVMAVPAWGWTTSGGAPWDTWLSTEAKDQGDAARWQISETRADASATALRSIGGDSGG